MAQKFQLFTSHFSRSNALTLKVFLGLTKTDEVAEWEYTDDQEAAMALLIDVDDEKGKLELEDCIRKNKRQVLIAFSSKTQGFPENILVLPRPLRSAEVLPILRQASERFLNFSQAQQVSNEQSFPRNTQPNSSTRKIDTVGVPAKSRRVLEVLYANRNKILKVISGGIYSAIFDMEHRRYYSADFTREEMDNLLISSIVGIQIEEINRGQCTQAIYNLEPQDLDVLLWIVALAVSNGQLFSGLSSTGNYRLNRWPDLKKLGQNSLHLKLTALLRRGGTIDYFADFLNTGPRDIIDFINACYVLNYLDFQEKSTAVPKVAVEPKSPDANKRGLFSRIRSRLGI